MMFGLSKFVYLFWMIFYLTLHVSSSSASEFNSLSKLFENQKSIFIKETNSNKLENYFKQIKMKNLAILNEKGDENFLFIDSSEKDRVILNKIQYNDLNFDKMQNSTNFDEFKARLFAFVFKNKNTNDKNEVYYPIGVNNDEEKETGWRIYLVLMSCNKDDKHKLLKVCFRENNLKDNFSIILNFDQSCLSIIDKIKKKDILKEDNSTKKLHSIQNKILSNSIKQNIEKNKKIFKKENSFIEQSSTTSTTSNTKIVSLDTLAQKFSVDELHKIKSLIKFAKTNGILDEISNKKGDIKLEDIKWTQFPNSTVTNYSIISQLRSEVTDLKGIVDNQDKKIEKYFKDLNQSMTTMKNMLMFIKELSGEFHKSLIVFGSTLANVNNKLPNKNNNLPQEYKFEEFHSGSNKISLNERKPPTNEINKLIEIKDKNNINKESTRLVNTNKTQFNLKKKKINQEEKAKLVSPFLANDNPDTSLDDELLEDVNYKANIKTINKSKATKDNFIDP